MKRPLRRGIASALSPAAAQADYEIIDPHALASGETTYPRLYSTSSAGAIASQRLNLAYFTARKSETVNKLAISTGGTAAGLTPTLCRMGLYEIADNGDGTLIAACANDVTLFAASFTEYARSVTTPVQKTRGQRYAFGLLVVTAAATPTFYNCGNPVGGAAISGISAAPRICGTLAGQSDLPASFTAASLGNTGALALLAAVTP